MPNVKISDAADAGTLVASDMLPLARSGDTNAYHATMTEIAAFASTSLASGAYGNVGRNLLHNPLFNVAQRGAGPFTSIGILTADRWRLSASLDTFSVTVVSDITDAVRTAIGDEGINGYISNAFTGNAGAGSYNFLTQAIENVRRLAGKTVTISFWAAASSALKVGINIGQVYGTGGSPSAPNNTNGVAVQLSNTWGTRYSATITVPSIVGKTLGTNGDSLTNLNLWFSCGTTNAAIAGNIGVQSGTISITGVQLEVGSVATPLEKPDPRYDLSNCLRFYFNMTQSVQLFGYASAAGASSFDTVLFPVPMRATPTATPVFTGGDNETTPRGFQVVTYEGFTAIDTAAGAGDFYVLLASCTFSADL